MKKESYPCWLLAALSSSLFLNVASAQVVVQHLGANDPLTEGFVQNGFTGAPDVGPVFDDLGRDAWMIKPNSTDDIVRYQHFLTEQQGEDAMTYGWELSATLRFVDSPPATSLAFDTGNEAFWMDFFTDPAGVLRVSDARGTSYSFEEHDGGYHSYKLEYDPLTELVNLWIDSVDTGVEFQSDISTGESKLRMGFGETATQIHLNELTVTIIPEPATVALLSGLGALVFAGIVRRRRRARRSGASWR